jgi:hypothetical protein
VIVPTDIDLVNLAANIYSATVLTDNWDHIDLGGDDGICWAVKKYDGYDVVVFRGSITAHDWLDDILVLPIGIIGPQRTAMGTVHFGFYAGMEKIYQEAKPLLTQDVYVTGHSLGAARAAIFAGLMKLDNNPPKARIVFGEPKPGLIDFGKYLADVPARSYRNGNDKHHDVITDVPLLLPPLQFVHPTPIVVVNAEPDASMFIQLGLFAYHHIDLYVKAVTDYVNGKSPAQPTQ